MDPVSYVLAAYLNTVQTSVIDNVRTQLDFEIKALSIQYGGQPVSFQHQFWKVKNVCHNTKQSITVYSHYTKDASRFFYRPCREFSLTGSKKPLQRKYTNMYCNAAASFNPTIASLEAGTAESEIVAARKACNTATVAVMVGIIMIILMYLTKIGLTVQGTSK